MKKFAATNIRGYCNHKMIGRFNGDYDANMNGIQNKVLLPELLPDFNKSVVLENVHFSLPEKSENNFDNVTCEEQIIDVPREIYTSIHVLGLCEYGNYCDNFRLNYSDGSMEYVSIFLKDWELGVRSWGIGFTPQITQKCRVVLETKNDHDETRYMYMCSSKLPPKSELLESIELPYNPYMHIFAITLESNEDDE